MVIIQGVGPCDLGSNPNTLTNTRHWAEAIPT
jgi:hypothetical protein